MSLYEKGTCPQPPLCHCRCVCVCVCVGLKCKAADGLAWWSTQGQSLEDGDMLSVSCDEMPAGM